MLSFDSEPERSATGLDLPALAITRSLGRSGVPVVRVHPNRLEASLRSRFVSRVAIAPDPRASEETVVSMLLRLADELAALLPSLHAGRWVIQPPVSHRWRDPQVRRSSDERGDAAVGGTPGVANRRSGAGARLAHLRMTATERRAAPAAYTAPRPGSLLALWSG